MRLSTLAVHAGEVPRVEGSVVYPIFQSATFLTDERDRYTRCNNNPSQLALNSKLAALHGAEAAMVTASGLAAISATLMTLLKAGDHILVQSCLYGGTHSFVHGLLPRMGVSVSELDLGQAASEWDKLVTPSTKVVYVETMSNPLCSVAPLRELAQFAARHGLSAVCDNTFASPVNCRPLEIGFTVVVESATKFISGHSDVIAGVVLGSADLVTQITDTLSVVGGSLDPHAAFLVQRGAKTLALRVKQHNDNALALATALQACRQVLKVHYPGLASHPSHELATSLFCSGSSSGSSKPAAAGQQLSTHSPAKPANGVGQSAGNDGAAVLLPADTHNSSSSGAAGGACGYGGVLAFELCGGAAAAAAVLGALKLVVVAPSLGGVETLVTRPSLTSHACLTAEERAARGISDGLIRVAVGVEDTHDLVQDFMQAIGTVISVTHA